MTPAFAYVRVSGPDQMNGDGPARQQLAIAEYAQKSGYEIVQTYQEAWTGKADGDDRPAMRQMFTDLINSKIGVHTVIVEKVDRLARDLIVQESIISRFQNYRIELVSTMEPDLCSADPSRVFIRQVLGAVAQLDRSLIVAKTRAARERIRNSGQRCEGRKMYGHRPGESLVIAQIVSLYRNLRDPDGGSYHTPHSIAEFLNFQGLKTRSGGTWTGVQVKRILEREKK